MHARATTYFGLCSSFALLLAACGSRTERDDASAREEEALVGSSMTTGVVAGKTRTYRQRLPIATVSNAPVTLGNGELLDVARAAGSALERHRQLESQLQGAGSALTAPADTIEEFVETEHTVMLVATTHMVVADPTALRGASPIFAAFRPKAPGSVTLSDLDPIQRKYFDDLRSKLLKKPTSHPLGAAARQSPAALLSALLAGKGDLTVTTTVEVPTERLPSAGGAYMAPAFTNGAFDYTAMHGQTIAGFGSASPQTDGNFSWDGSLHDVPSDGGAATGNTTTSGKDTTVLEFVNGFTQADAFEWDEDWNFTVGNIHVGAGASYGVGLRIPIEVTGTMDPTTILRKGSSDVEGTFSSSISVDVIDADEDFYEDAGLASIDIQNGQELVVNAEAHINVDIELFGSSIVNVTLPKGLSVDAGQDFRPPFDGCGTDCGLDYFLPAALTKTQVDVGVAGADARVGVNISGDGEVALDYATLFDHDAVASSSGNGAGQLTHTLSFDDTDARTFKTTLPALSQEGDVPYGYKVSNLEYTWNLAITPGVKGDVWVHIPFFDFETDIGPFWLDFAKIDLGSLTFGPHDGSHTSRSVNKGAKSWHQWVAADAQAPSYQP